ncbi:hypothetical protein M5E87_27035 [Flavonifractor plautii]|nr:hypothetical protein M5E87_27035 [Flavonifractor plautii]
MLYPALCAWGWAFGGCGLLLLFSGREALFPLAFTGFALLVFSFLLASPSALFMLLTLDLLSGSLRDAGVNAFSSPLPGSRPCSWPACCRPCSSFWAPSCRKSG